MSVKVEPYRSSIPAQYFSCQRLGTRVFSVVIRLDVWSAQALTWQKNALKLEERIQPVQTASAPQCES